MATKITYQPHLTHEADLIVWSEMWNVDFSWQLALPYVNPEAKMIIDLGCYSGLTTGCYAQAFPKADVIGIDMNLDSCLRAKENLSEFGDRVLVINAAIGKPRMEMANFKELYPPQDSFIFNEEGRKRKVVVIESLDDILSSRPHIDFIKIDIEGAEREIFLDANWPYKCNVIQLECHGYGYDSEDGERDLKSFGFNIVNKGPQIVATK